MGRNAPAVILKCQNTLNWTKLSKLIKILSKDKYYEWAWIGKSK